MTNPAATDDLALEFRPKPPMRVVQAPRASAILYGVLRAAERAGCWLIPANVCAVVPLTFLKAGVSFRFVDISPTSLAMDVEQIARRLGETRVAGVLYAHTYGNAAAPGEFFAWMKRTYPDTMIVDDRCLCIPDLELQPTHADVVLYSTGYSKIVDFGYGGYAFVADSISCRADSLPFDPTAYARLDEECRHAAALRAPFTYADAPWLDVSEPSYAWPEYAARIREALPASLAQRMRLNTVYRELLPSAVHLPDEFQIWRYSLRVPEKGRLLEAIFRNGLFASSHYASLAGIIGEGHAPNAERLAADVVNLFNDHRFDEHKARTICRLVLEHLQRF